MKLIDAKNNLAVRLYDWSLCDLHREMDEGCPLLSLVGLNNRYIAAFVLWVNSMPKVERDGLARQLMRNTHLKAAALRGEALTPLEEKRFREEFHEHVSIWELSVPPLRTADSRLPSFRPIDPGECIGFVFDSFPPVLGKPVRRKLQISSARAIGDWKLITEFTFHKPDSYLFYKYQFVRKDESPTIGHCSEPRALFMFYGISGTTVSVPSQADSEPMAKAIIKLAEHFVSQAEPLFAGLGIGD